MPLALRIKPLGPMRLDSVAAMLPDAVIAPITRNKGGEITEFRVKVARGESAIDAAQRGLEAIKAVVKKLPRDADLSARIEPIPGADIESDMKVMQGRRYVPTNPFGPTSAATYAATVLNLTDKLDSMYGVNSIVFRIAIPPSGALGVSGDGLIGGDMVELKAPAARKKKVVKASPPRQSRKSSPIRGVKARPQAKAKNAKAPPKRKTTSPIRTKKGRNG